MGREEYVQTANVAAAPASFGWWVGTNHTANGLGLWQELVGQEGQRCRNKQGGEMTFPRTHGGAVVELLSAVDLLSCWQCKGCLAIGGDK